MRTTLFPSGDDDVNQWENVNLVDNGFTNAFAPNNWFVWGG